MTFRHFARDKAAITRATCRPLSRLRGRVREGALAASLSHGIGPLPSPPPQAEEGSIGWAYRRHSKHCFAADS